ncbi:hypothetical protein CHS0354_014993 [Potamilus streckersoni]|uniref:Fibrinogen C-terminal domain-containing protein n=1 Tax=Potamilus streckersoni TaxID=2493646 RepID=A0AAE0SJ98_9BIVA|nr:hypothetical protein CHS0354_014993 [Potamilus streckersoni]
MVALFFAFLTFAVFITSGHFQCPCHCACNCFCNQPQTYCGNAVSSICHNDYFGKPRDCQDIYQMGFTKTGGYIIYPKGHPNGIYVRCDMHTAGGGWTVIQRRVNADVNFFREWVDYKEGFGDPNRNLWLGNDIIHDLTADSDYQLHINLDVSETNISFAVYDTFSVGDESSGYILFLKSYSGTAGDSFSGHSGMKFTTKDRDNDKDNSSNCANAYKGGWWYSACHSSNLNGIYGSTTYGEGINWYAFAGYHTSMIYADMKIRRKNSH